MENSENESLKRRMSLIANNFFKARDILRTYCFLNDTNARMLKTYIQSVQRAYDLLSDNEKELIDNEYFFDGKPQWWKSLFNDDEFERFHIQTLNHFMEGFYAILA